MVDENRKPGNRGDTICAVATPPGAGGVGIVRLSGPKAPAICEAMTGYLPEVRKADLAQLRDADGKLIDTAIVIFFSAPRSFLSLIHI